MVYKVAVLVARSSHWPPTFSSFVVVIVVVNEQLELAEEPSSSS